MRVEASGTREQANRGRRARYSATLLLGCPIPPVRHWLPWAIVLFVCVIPSAIAQDQFIDREYTIKAAMMLKIASFTTWPEKTFAGPKENFVVGILGANPFGNQILDQITRSELLQRRRIVFRVFPAVKDIKSCQILFIPVNQAELLPEVQKAVAGKPVLLIGDGPGLAARGVMANLVRKGENIDTIEVNLKAAERAQLSFKADFLKLKVVKVVDPSEGDNAKTASVP